MYPYDVLATVDISRVADTFAKNQLSSIVLVGREIDLLEKMRRSTKDSTLSIKMISLYASGLNIDSLQFAKSLETFADFRMIGNASDEPLVLRYTDSKQVYKYGSNRLKQKCSDAELLLVDFIAKSMKSPVDVNELDEALDLFDKEFRKGLKNFIIERIAPSIKTKKEEYVVSSRIYREKDVFQETLDIMDAHKVGDIITTLQSNPGIPKDETIRRLGLDDPTLDFLGKSGIIDPLNLNIAGDSKLYLFSSDLMNERADLDHLDLVKKTLANFRYGEHFSKGTRLYSLVLFFRSMLKHGYAGHAYPIGTDYHNLEVDGVVRVEKLSDGKFRFWMLKRDVIQDALDVLEGYTPFQLGTKTNGVTHIDDVITTRSKINFDKTKVNQEVAEAFRRIREGLKL